MANGTPLVFRILAKTPSVALSLCLVCLLGCSPEDDVDKTQQQSGSLPNISDATSYLPSHISPRPGPPILYEPYPAAPQLESVGIWKASPILISGAMAYRNGEFLYQDWLFDDRGGRGLPDLTDPAGLTSTSSLFSRRAGTLTYPRDSVYANNAADLVEFRVRTLPSATAFRITLNTLIDPEVVAFTLALGDSQEPVEWPFRAGVRSPAEVFITVHGNQAIVQRSGKDDALATVNVDKERRQIEVIVQQSLWNPASDVVRMAAGVGLWNTAANSYLQPGLIATKSTPGGASLSRAALFNIAFRDEPLPDYAGLLGRTIVGALLNELIEPRFWRERAQAGALATGDISEFFTLVNFAKLRSGATDESEIPRSGHLNRIFASRISFGQGVDYSRECGIGTSGECDGPFIGQLQPYGIYVPNRDAPPKGFGLTFLLHALSGNYNQYLGTRHAEQFGERGQGSIVVTPLGRGPDGFYIDAAEADVFEVWADVARYYPLDPDWVTTGGISMGGIGSFRLAARYPDLFARIVPVVASSPVSKLTPSLRNVPIMMWTSVLDELQPLPITEATIATLHANDLSYEALTFPLWDHLTPSTNDNYPQAAEFLGEHKIERNPARVSYVVDTNEDSVRVRAIAPRGAYWVAGIELRDESTGIGEVDIVTEGLGIKPRTPLALDLGGGVLSGGNREPAPYMRRIRGFSEQETSPSIDRVNITASNVSRLQINASRAGLSCSPEVKVNADGPLDVVFFNCPKDKASQLE